MITLREKYVAALRARNVVEEEAKQLRASAAHEACIAARLAFTEDEIRKAEEEAKR